MSAWCTRAPARFRKPRRGPQTRQQCGARAGTRAPALSAALARRRTASRLSALSSISWNDCRPIRPGCERLNADPALAARTLDMFEHSPYFAEELIRTPELLEEIGRAPGEDAPPPGRCRELRRWFRREMLRIQAQSICQSHPIFETLAQTSDLADAVIARAYEIAVDEVLLRIRRTIRLSPVKQMWVIALGRLGMREFDLASDADLVFVLADSEAAAMDLLDARGRAHDRSGHRLHRRRRAVRRRYAPASQRRRRPAGADRKRLQGIFRARRRGLGGHHLHEVARGGRRCRRAPKHSCINCRRSIGGDTARAGGRGPTCGKCGCGWKKSRAHRTRSRPAVADITTSIFC